MIQTNPEEEKLYVRAALNLFVEIIGVNEWNVRKKKIITLLSSLDISYTIPLSDQNKLKIKHQDSFGICLFNIEVHDSYGYAYDYMLVGRLWPFFISIGKNINHLKEIENFRTKFKAISDIKSNNPFPFLYEVCIALYYKFNGWNVEFIPESHLKQKTPDLKITKKENKMLVECKFFDKEHFINNNKFNDMWNFAIMNLFDKVLWLHFDIIFKSPIDNLKKDFLYKAIKKLVSENKTFEESNELIMSAHSIDKNEINNYLQENQVRQDSPSFIELIFNEFDAFNQYKITYVAEEIYNAKWCQSEITTPGKLIDCIGAKWSCTSNIDINKKIKNLFNKINKAQRQLYSDIPGIIHVGYERCNHGQIDEKIFRSFNDTINGYHFENIYSIEINSVVGICQPPPKCFDIIEKNIRYIIEPTISNQQLPKSLIFINEDHK